MIADNKDLEELIAMARQIGFIVRKNTIKSESQTEPYVTNRITFAGKRFSERKLQRLLQAAKENKS